MRAAAVTVQQAGYKLMMNSQCAGLTTRFAISRMFPDADIYCGTPHSRQPSGKEKLVASEGLDCFVAILKGMAEEAEPRGVEERIRSGRSGRTRRAKSQGCPVRRAGEPACDRRFSDVNHDGRADFYDGFLDFISRTSPRICGRRSIRVIQASLRRR